MGSPAHLMIVFKPEKVPMDPKASMHVFSGENRMPRSVGLGPMAAMRENTVAIRKGISQKPQMIVKGPQQGSSIRGFCVGVY